jgi:DNA-binding response OmpR family regulator
VPTVSTPRHVLVVDDQPEIRDLAALVLSGSGYRVSTAGSGREALLVLERDGADLVLLDINMPDIDGWQTLRLIRADEELAELPVVMFSVKGELQDKVHSLQEGASGYITKPFEVDALLSRVQRCFLSEGPGQPHRAPRPTPRS